MFLVLYEDNEFVISVDPVMNSVMIKHVNYKYQGIDCVNTGIYDSRDVIMVCYLVGEVNEASKGRIGER